MLATVFKIYYTEFQDPNLSDTILQSHQKFDQLFVLVLHYIYGWELKCKQVEQRLVA
jgi:hypothetical protein